MLLGAFRPQTTPEDKKSQAPKRKPQKRQANDRQSLSLLSPQPNRSMYVRLVVVHGEDILQIVLVGKHVNHPGKNHRKESATFGLASLFCMNRAEHAEFGVVAKGLLHFVSGGSAEVSVFMPAHHPERDPLVQLVFRRARASREHDALQLVPLGGRLVVQQRRWFRWIEHA